MAKKKSKRKIEKPGKARKIKLKKPYKTIHKERYINEDKDIAEIHAVKNIEKDKKFIRLVEDKYYFRMWHRWGFNIKKSLHLEKIFEILIKAARIIGWDKIKLPAGKDTEKQLLNLKNRLVSTQQQLIYSQERNLQLQKEYEAYKERYAISKLPQLEQDLEKFKELVKNFKKTNSKEEDVQKFLKEHTWLFGLDYIKQKPKHPVGSKSILDFYLERYNHIKDVFELKLPSDKLFDKHGRMLGVLGKAITQCIDYLEDVIHIGANRRLSIREEITGFKPKGNIIIGKIDDKDTLTKMRLEVLNSYLHEITIYTYDDIIKKAEVTLNSLKLHMPKK